MSLLGENNVGKSNFIEAIDFLRQNLSATLSTKEPVIKIHKNQDANNAIKIGMNVLLSNKELEFLFKRKESLFEKFKAHYPNKISFNINFIVELQSGIHTTYRIQQIAIQGGPAILECDISGKRTLLNLEHFLENGTTSNIGGNIERTQHFQIIINLIELVNKKIILIPTKRFLVDEVYLKQKTETKDGLSLKNALTQLKSSIHKEDNNKFDTIKDIIETIVPSAGKLRSTLDGEKVDIYFGEYSIDTIGTGLHQLLLLVYCLVVNDESVILLDEPELQLHPGAQRTLRKFLIEQSKEKQIILTTHSSIFTFMGENKATYALFEEKPKELKIEQIGKTQLPEKTRILLGMENKDYFFSGAVLLVEGESEEKIIPLVSQALGIDLEESGIKIITVGGKDALKYMTAFLKHVQDSNIPSFIILDKDVEEDKKSTIEDLKRQGLLEEGNYHIWNNGELEDNLSEKELIMCVKDLAKESDLDIKISQKELDEYKDKFKNKNISKILQRLCEDKEFDLSKPEFAIKIGEFISKEIKENQKETRKKREIEGVIKKIIALVKK